MGNRWRESIILTTCKDSKYDCGTQADAIQLRDHMDNSKDFYRPQREQFARVPMILSCYQALVILGIDGKMIHR